MGRDIDHAALAVQRAIMDKYGRASDLQALELTAGDKTITVRDNARIGEGSRDDLLSAIRGADSYDRFWELLPKPLKSPRQ